MIVAHAFGMIGQHLDYPAIGDSTVPALSHHPLKLGFEDFQAGNPLLDFAQVGSCNPIGSLA